MAIQFTAAQQKIIDARNHNILVSAAAGSGKTAVLVERIVRLVSEGDHPLDIDRLLVVTFTRAAAAQMRERIGQALSARLREDPGNCHLRRQEILLHKAQITTMDSFFTFILRNYFSDIALDPGFRQIDQKESDLIRRDVLKDFLEEKYARKDPGFLACADYFCTGSEDKELEELILKLFDQSGSHPSPSAWLRERALDYAVQDERSLFETPWMRSMVYNTALFLLESDSAYAAMEELCRQPSIPDKILPFIREERENLFGKIRPLLAKILSGQPCADQDIEDILQKKDQDMSEVERGQDGIPGHFSQDDAGAVNRKDGSSGGEEKDCSAGETEGLILVWEEIQRCLSTEFGKYPLIRGKKYEDLDPARREFIKKLRDNEKAKIYSLRKKIGGHTTDRIIEGMKTAAAPVSALSGLTLDFSERFMEEKRIRHVADFVDLEHFALDILAERREDGSYVPRRAARALRSHYDQILIDEYQDSNEVQELLLQIISGEEEKRYNRFMVGDIKQSIYRFRLARPEIFMEKYGSYRPDDPLMERIELDQNFRSRAEVLDCVNALFMRLMRKEIGGVKYDDAVTLKKGAVFPDEKPTVKSEADLSEAGPDPYCAEFLLLDTGTKEGDSRQETEEEDYSDAGDDPDRTEREESEAQDLIPDLSGGIRGLTDIQKEALLIAGQIRRIRGSLPVRDEESGKLRPARYGDIVILLRNAAGWNEQLKAVLAQEGIPAYAESGTGYFAAEEIRTVIGLLHTLDNPGQDIPLYSALRGFFGGFTQDEITRIRLVKPDGLLFDALRCAAGEAVFDDKNDKSGCAKKGREGFCPELSHKCREFLSFIRYWRERVRYLSVSDLVSGLLEETGYLDYCTALPAGDQRRANLSLLKSQADNFTKTDFTGLFQFLRYIEGLIRDEIDYGEANTLDENADVVRIMTIHKSKGLEFPVCIIAGLCRNFLFRRKEASGLMLLDGDWGLGINSYDPVSRIRTTTLRREGIADKICRDSMGEELRVLYVALTRAKEKLIMVGSAKGLHKKLESWKNSMAGFYRWKEEQALPASMIAGASSYAELIYRAVLAQEKGEGQECSGASFPVMVSRLSEEDLVISAVQEQRDLAVCGKILRELEGIPLQFQPDPKAAAEIAARFFRVYPHEELAALYAQTSVSELKHRDMERALRRAEGGIEEGENELYPSQTPVPYVPAFIRREKGDLPAPALTEGGKKGTVCGPEISMQENGTAGIRHEDLREKYGARRGTAFHRVLEIMDYSNRKELLSGGPAAVLAWIGKKAEDGRISSDDAALVSEESILDFLLSDLAGRMEAADAEGLLFREQPFVMGVPADRIDPGFPAEEMINVQGIIDAFFIEDGKIILVDYKTDRVKNEEELILRYKTQLALYADALERAYGLPVREEILYSTALKRQILYRHPEDEPSVSACKDP